MLKKLTDRLCLCMTFLVLSTLVSCSGKDGARSGKPEVNANSGPGNGDDFPTRDEQGDNTPHNPKLCKGARVLKVLDSGKEVVSRLTKDSNRIINWNIYSGKTLSSLNFPVNPYEISPDGKYLIRQISYKKYQIITFTKNGEEGFFNKVISLNAAYEPMPRLSFSADSKYLLFSYRPYAQGYSHQIEVYSLDEEKVVSSLRTKNVFFAGIARDSKSFLVGFKKGYNKFLQKIDIETTQVQFEIALDKYERYSQLHIGRDVFVLMGMRKNYAFDLYSGAQIYTKRFTHLVDIDSTGELALVSESWNELKIINLITGEDVFKATRPAGLVLSTCQVVSSPMQLFCQDPINQGKMMIWNLETDKVESACF